MPATPNPVDALRSVHDALLERSDSASAMVASAINGMLHGLTFEAGMGLAPGWHTAMRLRQRDAALRALAKHQFAGLKGRAQALAMVARLRAYEACRWPRDQVAGRPDGLDGYCYDVMQTGPAPAAETVRKRIG